MIGCNDCSLDMFFHLYFMKELFYFLKNVPWIIVE